MAQQTILTISYIATPPSTLGSAVLPIPASQVNTTTGVTDYSGAIRNLFLGGGFFLPGTTEWIPYSMIVSVTAS